MKRILFFCGLSLLTGCSDLSDQSELNFIPWSQSSIRQSSLRHARQPSFKICLNGSMNSNDLQRVQNWAARSVLTWLRAVKVIDNEVQGKIEFSCQSSHLTISLRPGGGTSFASPGKANIYMTRPYGTWTHELGHAFAGLSDTYSGRSAGVCKSGHPQSLMCWGAYGPRANPDTWSTLWEDDIKGIHHTYKVVFGSELQAPDWAGDLDLVAAVDINQPWPDARGPISFTVVDSQVVVDDLLADTEIDYDNRLGSIDW